MTNDPSPALDFKAPYTWLATWFGCGLINPAPGTWGSLGALPFGIAIFAFTGIWGLAIATILITIIGYWASDQFEKATNTHDNKMIVIDEVAGQWIALMPVFYFSGYNPTLIIAAFILFRIFDILKPWPVSFFDKKVKGAAGVMGDDIIAGLYAAGCLIGLIYAGLG